MARLLGELHLLRHVFGVEGSEAKRWILGVVAERQIRARRLLVRYHEDLLYLRAFPDDAAVLASAERELGRIGARVRRLPARERGKLDDSGIAGSVSRYVYPYGVATWLVSRHPGEARIDWANAPGDDPFDQFARPLLTQMEGDAFDSGELDARRWIRLGSKGAAGGDLAWLLQRVAGALPAGRRAPWYDVAEVPVKWSLAGSDGSVTTHAVPVRRAFYRKGGMRPAPADPVAFIAAPADGVERAGPSRARLLIDSARNALAARCREVHAVTWANPREVYEADLGEGVALAVIGAQLDQRMTLEANYGYMLFSNGVPIGYGGVSPLFFDANTGINVFDPFRGSEAAYLWSATLRAFQTIFGVRRFVVNGYQFGEGNDEALQSGAFWFYYRLGFRPSDAEARRLAAAEARKMRADRRYRSDLPTLRRLARGDLHLVLPGFDTARAFDESWLGVVARGVTRELARRAAALPDASRERALAELEDEVSATLGARRRHAWPAAERRGFAMLAPVVSLTLRDVARWPTPERAALVQLLRAKGHPQESTFVSLAQRHRRWLRSLARWARAQAD